MKQTRRCRHSDPLLIVRLLTARCTARAEEKSNARQITRNVSLQESQKMVELLRSDIGKMRDENGALIRVISKLSK